METEWIIQLYTRCLHNRNGQLATMSVEKARSSSFMTLYISLTWLLDAGRENRIVLDLHSWCRCQWHFNSTAMFHSKMADVVHHRNPSSSGTTKPVFSFCTDSGISRSLHIPHKTASACSAGGLQTFSVDHTDNHHAWGKQRAVHTRSLANKPVSLSWCNESGPDKTRLSSLLAKWDSFGLVKGSWLRLRLTSIHGLNPCFKFPWRLHWALHLLFKREKVCPNETIILLTQCFVFEWNPGVFSPFSVWFFRQMRRWWSHSSSF